MFFYLFVRRWIADVKEKDIAGAIQRFSGSKGQSTVQIFGGAGDPCTLRAIEGQLLAIHCKKILTKEDAQVLKLRKRLARQGVVVSRSFPPPEAADAASAAAGLAVV